MRSGSRKTLIYKKSMPIANNMKVKRYVLRDALKAGGDDFMSFDENGKAFPLKATTPPKSKRSCQSPPGLLEELPLAGVQDWRHRHLDDGPRG
jgi:hypothetical protein